MLLEAMLSRSLQVPAGVQQIFSASIAPIVNNVTSSAIISTNSAIGSKANRSSRTSAAANKNNSVAIAVSNTGLNASVTQSTSH